MNWLSNFSTERRISHALIMSWTSGSPTSPQHLLLWDGSSSFISRLGRRWSTDSMEENLKTRKKMGGVLEMGDPKSPVSRLKWSDLEDFEVSHFRKSPFNWDLMLILSWFIQQTCLDLRDEPKNSTKTLRYRTYKNGYNRVAELGKSTKSD